MKHILCISAPAQHNHHAFARVLLEDAGPRWAQQSLGCIVNLVTGDPQPHWHAIVELWLADETPFESLDIAQYADVIHEYAAYSVSEQVEKDELLDSNQRTTAIKQIAAWQRRSNITSAQAQQLWDKHVPLANRVHVGCVRYVRHRVLGASSPSPAYEGFAFQYFLTQQDLQARMFDKPESVQLIMDDTSQFIEQFEVFVCQEHIVKSQRATA